MSIHLQAIILTSITSIHRSPGSWAWCWGYWWRRLLCHAHKGHQSVSSLGEQFTASWRSCCSWFIWNSNESMRLCLKYTFELITSGAHKWKTLFNCDTKLFMESVASITYTTHRWNKLEPPHCNQVGNAYGASFHSVLLVMPIHVFKIMLMNLTICSTYIYTHLYWINLNSFSMTNSLLWTLNPSSPCSWRVTVRVGQCSLAFLFFLHSLVTPTGTGSLSHLFSVILLTML